MTSKPVRLRVAPSPTGYPHVGTAFQALFDYIYAKKKVGQFIIRIEDTDQKRLVPEAEEVIYEALDWLKIYPDESPMLGGPFGPYRQSARLPLYRKSAQELMKKKKAYYCFCSTERLKEMRRAQQQQKLPPRYDRQCFHLSPAEVKKKLQSGEKAAIRMLIPENETIAVNDLLRGEVKFDSNLLDDQVILKSDGFPTYHLAVVVDDHLMQISHVVRGEEWLPSSPKHVLLYRFLGWQEPRWIHTPILRNPDHSKLSKRHGHTSIEWYREQGYLPEALINFLALLVWNHPQEKEIFSVEEMIEYFDFAQMRFLAPIFDLTKLDWLNGNHLRLLTLDELAARVKDWALRNVKKGDGEVIQNSAPVLEWMDADLESFKDRLALAQDRLKKFSEVREALEFYYQEKLIYDREDLLQGYNPPEVLDILRQAKKALEDLQDWESEVWEKSLRELADELEIKHKDLFMILRAATTARKATPPLFDVMLVVGKEKVFQRIDQAAEFLKGQR